MSDLILRDDSGGIAHLELNSPGNFNALSDQMITALDAVLDSIAADPTIRVVVLSGAGKAFCAGHDLRQMQAARDSADQGRAAFEALFARCAKVMQKIPTLPQPVIAQVHGIATAAGCQLAASCDLVTAAEDARFGVNGINIGLFCSTPMVALTRVVPPKLAFEMLTTGGFISAERAYEAGLVNRIFAPDDLAPGTRVLAETLAAKLPAALRIGKRAFYDQQGLALTDAYQQMGETICDNLMRADTAEGIAAFLDKREPDWP
ncbi:MAG: enoyl-CoA hydratase [Paracoccus sp. (in: a-proteobacteria)]|uniref:enoyl-CoA hydratase n=1 Tax=Paracoccus sp. TaxID=267 RepID=UPI0026DFEEFB|nr:enoyl-CoA hydratase [Paracoccus sp. (in: a-proteobacteria)]MDO5622444.1 enoyl-CoA hydratase [Paracoccus sp. (in: a-proteobacteria)]